MSSKGLGIDLSVPLTGLVRDQLRARLEDRSIVEGECRVWTGWIRNAKGHGAMSVGDRPTWVHRVSFAVHHGPIAFGLVVRHRCDNPRCIRPEHLELGTQGDNVRDMIERERMHRRFPNRRMKVSA